MAEPTNSPELFVYVTRNAGDKSFFTKVGAAWANTKGGFSVKLEALPVNGELVLLPPKTPSEEG